MNIDENMPKIIIYLYTFSLFNLVNPQAESKRNVFTLGNQIQKLLRG